jgi:hypothetical protein
MSNTENTQVVWTVHRLQDIPWAQSITDTFGIEVVYHDTNTGKTFSTVERKHRPLHEIARDIRSDWSNPYFGAVPYLDALRSLDQITDRYFEDDAETVVRYLLANLGRWRGETARTVKAELKAILKGVTS